MTPALRDVILLHGYSAEASALFSRASTQPAAADKAAIDTALKGLKAASLLTKFDGLWVTGADTAQFGQRNWVQDLYNLIPINSPAFTTKGGYKGDGSSSYLQFGADHNAWAKFAQNDAHMMVWVVELPTVFSTAEIGIYSGTDRARLRVTDNAGGAGKTAGRINQASTSSPAGITRGTWMIIVTRADATNIAFYRNDDQSQAVTVTSEALTASAMGLLRSLDSHSDARIVAASLGSGLSAVDKSNLYSILGTCLTTMGVPTS